MSNKVEFVEAEPVSLKYLKEGQSFVFQGNLHYATGKYMDSCCVGKDAGYLVICIMEHGVETHIMPEDRIVKLCEATLHAKVVTK
ncbi:hypothetical protein NVP1031O_098 [Vibrio phage 1.031.O._10N.261.46.F8]|nr:hypothetical protein NVP1031O_098 [Vibrio phage 1.031.O._10N.261.46.F8]